MRKKILSLPGLILFSLFCYGQPVIFIQSGSRANWGNNQELTIYANGEASFVLREVNGSVKDSSRFMLGAARVDSFFQKADQVKFFSLSNRYEGSARDGSGVYISVNNNGRRHSVHVINETVPPVDELVGRLNEMLGPHRVRIFYGQDLPKQ